MSSTSLPTEAQVDEYVRRMVELQVLRDEGKEDTAEYFAALAIVSAPHITCKAQIDQCKKGLFSQVDVNDVIPFDLVEENRRFTEGAYWNALLESMPQEDGWEAEISHIGKWLRVRLAINKVNNSNIGETYLVGWVLHNLPNPLGYFLRESFGDHERPAQECEWPIEALEEHMTMWMVLFNGPAVREHIWVWNNANPDRFSLKPWEQRQCSGGYAAAFLFSNVSHRRWARHNFKLLWRTRLLQGLGKLVGGDVKMTG
jgi:hypothetical protein